MSFGLGALQRRLLGPVIPIVRVQGIISGASVQKLEKSLSHINPQRSQAIAVLVNSPGGLGTATEAMTQILKIFKEKHHLPLYTFAECQALSAGYGLLSTGDKVYADQSSWVGSIGALTQYAKIQGFLKKHNVDVKTWTSNPDLLRLVLDPVTDISRNTAEKKLSPLSKSAYDCFVEHVESFRDRKITVPKEERAEKLYQGDIWTGKEAVTLGLVDKIGTFQEILEREFPDAKLVEVTKLSAMDRFREKGALIQEISNWDERDFLGNVTQNFLSSMKGK